MIRAVIMHLMAVGAGSVHDLQRLEISELKAYYDTARDLGYLDMSK